MRHIILINLNDYWRPNARASVHAAAARWDADVIELKQPILPTRHVWNSKFAMSTLGFQPGTRLLWLDCDMVVRDDCPSPFDEVPPDQFGAVRSFQGDTHNQSPDKLHKFWWDATCRQLGIDPGYDLSKQINGGLLLWTAGVHDRIFKAARMMWGNKQPKGTCEQVTWTWAMQWFNEDFYYLPIEFNRVGPVVWEDDGTMQNYWVAHYAAYGRYRPEQKAAKIDNTQWRQA